MLMGQYPRLPLRGLFSLKNVSSSKGNRFIGLCVSPLYSCESCNAKNFPSSSLSSTSVILFDKKIQFLLYVVFLCTTLNLLEVKLGDLLISRDFVQLKAA